ncbi:uncharacterized protein K489DRAFT_367986 [Dissoconium aciculare CBS 342.82]|uniref:Variant-specific surface protein n=1 Tax=Dissoconium aciculare CBS 342.82 TaxID=1314786 RepID=A0A6J3MFN2_9PEZI|nr:uncharacterized protein K489DRAFT_367986 [Dissoconium aciculare CBS 342.82]KAF1826811.1 hypothetical protein K489DRAFT_367986 [Dissoconium aciculare CBS 342.82]
MQSFTILIAALFGTLAASSALQPTCTNTVTHLPACCPPVSAYTATEYSACSGCALTTTTRGPQCLVACGTKTSTVSATTTITACATCTSTSTVYQPACRGCVITKSAETTTQSIDCKGCVVETETKVVGGVCAPVCIGGIKTTTLPGTSTITACAASIKHNPKKPVATASKH